MNRFQRHAAPAAAASPWHARAWLAAAWLGVAPLACLPSEPLSQYSSGQRASEPGLDTRDLDTRDLDTRGLVSPGSSSDGPTTNASESSLVGADNLDCGGNCMMPDVSVDAGAGAPTDPGTGGATDPGTGGGTAPVTPPDGGAPESGGGASPVDAGSAGPSCVGGALLGPDDRCFALVSATASFAVARSSCQSRGAGWDLAKIRDPDRNAWLAALLGSIPDAWVGATDLALEGDWRWLGDAAPFWRGTGTTGSSIGGAYESWSNGGTPEPNGDDSSDCARLRPNGGWADSECDTLFASLCEGPPL